MMVLFQSASLAAEFAQRMGASNDAQSNSTTPCAACKMLRRRCGDECTLAPYFPSRSMNLFALAHKIYGASNIVKIIKAVPKECRQDTVSSLVYEAWARAQDPVYGCAGVVSRMQSYIASLESQIASANAEIARLKTEYVSILESFQHLLSAKESLPSALPGPFSSGEAGVFEHDVHLWETSA